MAVYHFDSLDLERPTFRQVLLRKKFFDRIECELIEASFDEDEIIPYDALSYTWGDEEANCVIFVDGKRAMITPNLYEALLHIRSSTEDIVLWIDAICINQADLPEKNHQVAQMTEIYRRADHVMVWLGNSTGPTDDLMSLLVKLDHLEKLKRVHGTARDAPGGNTNNAVFQMRSLRESLGTGEDSQLAQNASAFHQLLERPWFHRVWVLQEAASARRLSVRWGNNRVTGRTFRSAAELLRIRLPDHTKWLMGLMGGSNDRTKWWNQKRDLRTILVTFRGTEARDERDKIFALLGLCQDVDQELLKPDYTLSNLELIRKTLAALYRVPEKKLLAGTDEKFSKDPQTGKMIEWTITGFLENLASVANSDIHSILRWGDVATVESWLNGKEEKEQTMYVAGTGPWVVEKKGKRKRIGFEMWLLAASNAVSPGDVMAALMQHRSEDMLAPEVLRDLIDHIYDEEDSCVPLIRFIPLEKRGDMLRYSVEKLFSGGGKNPGGFSRLSDLLKSEYYDQNEEEAAGAASVQKKLDSMFRVDAGNLDTGFSGRDNQETWDKGLFLRLLRGAPDPLRTEVSTKIARLLHFRPTTRDWDELLSRFPPEKRMADGEFPPWEVLCEPIVFVLRDRLACGPKIGGGRFTYNECHIITQTPEVDLPRLQKIWGLPTELRIPFSGPLFFKGWHKIVT